VARCLNENEAVEIFAACSAFGVTLGLVVTRPRLTRGFRVSPWQAAVFGVIVMTGVGLVTLPDIHATLAEVWRSFVALAAIMIMTQVAHTVGVLELWAARVESRAATTGALFALVFGLGVVTASTLNNDAAILLLTPLVITLARRRFPGRPALALPLAFAVFMAAGVAPLVVSNPMNMIVAEYAGIGFNEYALRMLPIAIAGWLVAYYVLRHLFRKELEARSPKPEARSLTVPKANRAQKAVIALLVAVLGSYSIVGYAGGPVWVVAVFGAVVAISIAARETRVHPLRTVRDGVSWRTLGFLLAVLVLATGMLNAGFVEYLTGHYESIGSFGVGATSAAGSAVFNNHPMAYMNMLALEAHGDTDVLAALIGGDLGPRLLPMGSLAGLLWIDMLARAGIEVPVRTFFRIGLWVTVPALLVSLGILSLY